MTHDITLAIVGSGGDGAVAAGDIIAFGCAHEGLHVMKTEAYGPQIRGGESSCTVRVSTKPIHAQADALAQAVPEEARNRDDNSLRDGIRPPQTLDDREKILQDRIDRAKTSEERNALYLQMARLYVEKGDIRARDFVAKIDDSDLRKQATSFIDTSLVMRAIDNRHVETRHAASQSRQRCVGGY